MCQQCEAWQRIASSGEVGNCLDPNSPGYLPIIICIHETIARERSRCLDIIGDVVAEMIDPAHGYTRDERLALKMVNTIRQRIEAPTR